MVQLPLLNILLFIKENHLLSMIILVVVHGYCVRIFIPYSYGYLVELVVTLITIIHLFETF